MTTGENRAVSGDEFARSAEESADRPGTRMALISGIADQ
jgi:hypothetical protein